MAAPDTTAVSIRALFGTLIGLITIAVCLRFYARCRQTANLRADDWLTIPVWASFVAGCGCYFHMIDLRALGYSSYEVSKEEVKAHLQSAQTVNISGNILFTFGLGCGKLSVLLFYHRIFCAKQRKAVLSIVIMTIVVLSALWTAAYPVFLGVQCRDHFSALWDGTQAKYCAWAFPVIWSGSISDFIFDIIILVLPIPLVLQLHTTPTRKISIMAIFLLACIGLVASIVRMVVFTKIVIAGPEAYRMDHQRQISRSVFYMALELGIVAVAINLPSIWAVFAKIGPETIVGSGRSAISLASMGSRRSNDSHASHGSDASRGQNIKAQRSATSISSSAPLPPGQLSKLEDEEFGLEALETARADRINIQRDATVTNQ